MWDEDHKLQNYKNTEKKQNITIAHFQYFQYSILKLLYQE